MKNLKQQKSFFPYFWKYKKAIIVYLLLLAGGAALAFWSSIETANFLNNLAENDINKAFYTLIAVTLIPLGFYLTHFISQTIYIKTSAKIALDIKKDLSERVLQISTATMDHTSTGVVINRIANDPENLINSLDGIVNTITNVITCCLTIVYITILNWIIGVAVIIVVLILVGIEIIRGKLFYKYSKKTKKLAEPATALTSEMVRSQKDIKTLGLESTFAEKIYENYEKYKEMSQKTSLVQASWFRVRQVANQLLVSGIACLALVLLDQGIVSLAVVLYVYTNKSDINMLAGLVGNLTRSWANFKVSSERVRELYDEELYQIEHYGSEEYENLTGSIEFKNVAFSYIERKELPTDLKNKKQKTKYEYKKHKVFSKLNFKIEENTTVAFVGVSGSGKSTILSLMAKLGNADSGQILVGGKDIVSLSKNTIRNHMILINQFPYVFDMTIRENILLAKPDATNEQILKACKDANLLNHVNKLPDGLDTKIGENGVKMSGGEKQRLAIARALIKNSPIIMFDESTSSLDNVAQAEVTKSIQKLSGKHTVIIVAHRLSTIRNVDKIYFLEKGKIIDEGTFSELNARNKKFQNIFRAENLEDELAGLKMQNGIADKK